jgi:hypothetical protein
LTMEFNPVFQFRFTFIFTIIHLITPNKLNDRLDRRSKTGFSDNAAKPMY